MMKFKEFENLGLHGNDAIYFMIKSGKFHGADGRFTCIIMTYLKNSSHKHIIKNKKHFNMISFLFKNFKI
jgi:hypothetical protein